MKKILFVTHTNPFSTSFGAEQRTAILLEAFLQNNCKADIAYIGRDSIQNVPDKQNINIRINGVSNYYPSFINKVMFKLSLIAFLTCKKLSKAIDLLNEQNNYDFIVCRYIDVAELAGLWKHRAKLILDIDDLPHQTYKSILSERSLSNKRRIKAMELLPHKWIKFAYSCFLPDKKVAEEYGAVYFPNIPLISTQKVELYEQNILFIGKMDWKPNCDGLMHFIEKCWDQISERRPNTKLYIAGKGLSEDNRKLILSYKNIDILGFVPNIYDFYSLGNIVIAPIYSGSGTNIKVIEAMAMAKACVITTSATRGFEHILQNGKNVLVVNNDEEFISNLMELTENQKRVKEIAHYAFSTVGTEYSQTFLNKIIKELIYV